MSNAKNLMRVMECFQHASGLKINFIKSKVYGIGVSNEEVDMVGNGMRCMTGKLPFVYLGLPIGLNLRNRNNWKEIIEKIKTKLSDWKAKTISFGGRLTLVKAVLGSMPLYYFSLFRAPMSILKVLESVRRIFFWGGDEENKKMAWIKLE